MHSDKHGPRGGAGRRARRGGHMTRGPAEAGVVQRFNGPRRGGERHTVYPDREAFYPDYCDASGATPAKSYRELTEGPSASSGASPASSTGVSRTGKSAPQKLYLCPACKQPYDLYDRNGCYVGRVPLVLECFHTACQECIYRRAVGGTAECPECSARSTVPIGLLDNLQAVFLPNYHIVGMVVWHRRGNTNRRAPDIRLVAAGPSVPPSVVSVEEEEESFEVMKTCFIEQCGQKAEVRCAECGVDYCAPCSASMHRSVRALSGHQPKMLMRVDPLVLPRCELHNTANEVLCKRCDMKMCIYCFLEEHEGHEKDYLNRLSVEETEEMRQLREDAQVVLEQLQYTQKHQSLHPPGIRLVAAGPSVPPSVVSIEEEESFEVTKTCFIEQCGQRAEVRCTECGVDYCAPCSASMHRSVRALSGHQPKMLMRVDPLVLPRCELHNTANEVLCKRCDMKMCIYCFLEEHEGHEKDYLNRLSVEETEEMRRLREDAQVVLEQLQYTQKHQSLHPPGIRLVAAGLSVPPSVVSVEEEESFEVMKTCFIEQCGQRAEVRCAECGVDYCAPCSASMHRSVRALSGHQPKMLMRVDPLVLPRCELHNTANEVLCKRCDMKMCIYCFLEEHEGHEKDYLNRLSVEETEEMRRLREDAQVVLEQLQYTQKEIETLMDFDPGAIQTETCSAFASLYARLAAAERRVLSKAEAAAKDASLKAPRGLREAASAASSGAARLRRLLDIDVSGGASANALDAKRLLRELREVKSLPRFLIDAGGGTGSLKPIRFVSKLDIDNLEDKFDVEIGSEADYVLVTEEQLPEDYKMPQISGRRNKMKNKRKKQIEDVTTSGTSSGGEQMNDSSGDSRVKAGKRLDIENERVVVTYIRSMDSVFVQLKKVQGRVDKLTKDIASYVASTGLQWQPLERLQQNDIYLALYETRTQQEWCRGRIIEVRPSGSSDGGAICDVLFVDFGHEQTMAARRLRPLPNQFRLASVPPLAREVRIAAPPGTTWAAGAHLQLGRLVHGRELIVRLVSTPSGINSSPLVDLLLLPPNDRHTADPTSICDLLVYAHDALETQKNKSTPENQQIAPKKIRVRKLKTTSVNEGEDEGVTALERPRVAKAGGSLQKGRCERVEVTSVKDPGRLYVRVLSYAPTFDRLRENMGRYYGQAAAGPQKTPPVVGSFVAAEINETWQRARVDHIDLDTRIAHIYLVDNGADIQVPLAVLRPLREQFSRLAAQAVPVQLADVEPISDTWSDPAVKLLRSYMAPNNTDSLRMIVVEQATENDDNSDKNSDMSIPKVVLLQTSGDNAGDVCVNGRLVAMGFAHAIGPMGEDEYWPSGAVEAPSVVAAKAAEKKAKLEANPTQDDAFVDEMIRKIHEESAVAVAEGYEEDDSPGSAKQPVEVLLVNDPDRIFVCFEMQRETAEKLHRELQVYYNDTDSKAAATNSTATREVNDYCAARCANNVYRRARVLGPSESKKDEESNKYRVYLVDVGQELDMAAEDLFDLDQYFHAFKQIAYGCHMSRIKPAGDTGRWSASASDALRKLLVSRPGVRLAPAGPPDSRDGPSGKIRSLPARFWYPTQSQSASGRYYACAEEALVKLGFAYRLKAKEMSNSVTSSKKTDDSVVSSSKWIDLVEMEEKRVEKEEIESKSPYRTREVAVNDWLPPFKLQRRDFEAVITCAEIGGGLFLHDEQLHTVYVNLEDKICAYFSATTSNNEVISHWPPGRMCTVRWNDGWYRARVLSSNTPTSIPGTSSFNPSVVHVFMVDFGSDHDVPASDLRPEILFPDVPPFATKVKLEGVKAVSGSWLPQDYDLLMETLEKAGDRLRVKVVGSMEVAEPSVRVRLPNGRDLAETLAEGSENLTATAAEVSDEEEEVVVEEVEEEEEGESENTVEPVSQQQESVSEETHISSTTESGSVSGSTDEGPTEV